MKILVATGSSGGHIFPAIAFLDALKEKYRDSRLLLVLPQTSLRLNSQSLGYEIKHISVSGLSLRPNLKNFISFSGFIKGSLESLCIILRFKPQVVIGFGSLASLAVVIFAWFLRIPVLIHEQNVIPGRANRLLAKFASRVAISFTESKGYLKIPPRKIVFSGNPLRKEIAKIEKNQALRFFSFIPDKFTMLVMGGSQGSYRINTAFPKAISGISGKSCLQIIHLAGPSDHRALEKVYQNSGINVRLFAFLKEMQYAYSAADLILSRAGATTISEIIFFKLPAIIVPYPYAYRHQMANAKILEDRGCAVIFEDSELDAERLKNTIDSLIRNPERLEVMRSGYAKLLMTPANDLLAEEAVSLIKQ